MQRKVVFPSVTLSPSSPFCTSAPLLNYVPVLEKVLTQ